MLLPEPEPEDAAAARTGGCPDSVAVWFCRGAWRGGRSGVAAWFWPAGR